MTPLARLFSVLLFATMAGNAGSAHAQKKEEKKTAKPMSKEAQRGKYLAKIAGCNDCHTPAYMENAGKVDEATWLTGDTLGWRGPWGTTYASNLRLVAKDMTAEQFVARARSELRPPMPWFAVRDMTDADVKAIYAYIRHLGPAGNPAPAYLPPDKTPSGPFIQFPGPPPGASKGK
jgi:mono/diheme cytochrome c family protein